ncbi:hypothetical protein ACROYT_G002314 [Oculina patagonica]
MASIIVSNEHEDLHQNPSSIHKTQCPRIGSLWVLGQCTTSITSVALTLERYLCIVFSMKPDIRMTPRLASLAIALNWVVAAFMMCLAHYLDIYEKNFLCIPVTHDMLRLPRETRYTIAIGSIGIIFYLVTIPMYVHIYTVVKRSSQQMGVQRESTLAKRIAVLVGTNLVFFFMPILLLDVSAYCGLTICSAQFGTNLSNLVLVAKSSDSAQQNKEGEISFQCPGDIQAGV